MTQQEKEKLFHTQLVKYGVKYEQAKKAAKIIVSQKPDELLTDEERQLVTEACIKWSSQYKRCQRLSSTINSLKD